jgi:hypothetical protein
MTRNIWDQMMFDYPNAKGKEDALCPTRSAGGTCQCVPTCARCGIGPHMGTHLKEWPIHRPYDHQFVWPDPAAVPSAPPVLTSLDPATAALGTPDFTLHVRGTDVVRGSVIVFAGQTEPTTYVSATELTTGVNMAVWLGPDPAIPVLVRHPDGRVSNHLLFSFTAATKRA